MGSSNRLPEERPKGCFEALPVTLDLSPSRALSAGQLLLTVCAFVFAGIFRANLGPVAAATDPTVSAITTGIPLAVIALGVIMLLSRREARFDASAGGLEWLRAYLTAAAVEARGEADRHRLIVARKQKPRGSELIAALCHLSVLRLRSPASAVRRKRIWPPDRPVLTRKRNRRVNRSLG